MKRYIVYMLSVLFLTGMAYDASAQVFAHEQSKASDYEWPADPQVLEKLDTWQDLKFGVLLTWGLYSVPGIVESWTLCSEDHSWNVREGGMTYEQYKEWYFGLKHSFNPAGFNPDQWAEVMADAGMKYMLFMSKHHDGFCMYDTKTTDFSITQWAFRNDPRKDVARHVWDSFRKKDFMLGCYFSKPDWHCEWYWNPYFATATRHNNYKIKKHPDWWQKYEEFTHAQLKELLTNYGLIDILWLDGGWVKGDAINLDKVLSDVRTSTQPGLICVDRTARGRNENYQTPEQKIPEVQLNYPWESCVTLTENWGWDPTPDYKSPQTVINILSEICAKGGSLLLGVGPTPNGVIEEEGVKCLHEIGEWLERNGKAIYSTRTTTHYNEGNLWFTADKDGKTLYAIYALPKGEELPPVIEWAVNIPQGPVRILDSGKKMKYEVKDGKVTVFLDGRLKNEPIVLTFIKQ